MDMEDSLTKTEMALHDIKEELNLDNVEGGGEEEKLEILDTLYNNDNYHF